VLLIIFMIAAPIASVDIHVDLPQSRIIPSKRPPKPTWVSVQDHAGQLGVFVMNDPTTMEQLGQSVYDAVNRNSPMLLGDEYEILDQRIYVRADASTRYKNVMRVMNRLQDRGFTKIALVAEDRRGR
jgi:biopolymer transport protein ExbD